MTPPDSDNELRQVNERIKALQRAVYYLIWKRTGFGEVCVHCSRPYPDHDDHCKCVEIEQLVR